MRTKAPRVALLGVLIAALGVLLLPLSLVAPAGVASACSIGSTGGGYARYGLNEAERAQVLLVGTVTRERSIPRPPNTQPTWESVVSVEAMLKGDDPGEPIVIPYIGFLGGDCSGGPRLREGERVLLAVHWGTPSYGDGQQAWQTTTFGKVLLKDGQAMLDWTSGMELLGPSDEVIRAYGERAGAGDEQIEAAIEGRSAPMDASERGGVPMEAIVAGIVVAVVAGCLGIWRVRRRADSRA